MTPFAHTGSTFEKLLKREICRINYSTNWRKLRINITNSSGEIKLWKFQWRHSRIPEVLLKKLLQHDIWRIKSSIHWRKLRINIVNSSGEIKLWKFKWRHSGIPEVLSKSCWILIDAKFSPLFTGANCALILLIVAENQTLNFFMTSFAHTGSTFEKVVSNEMCGI